MAHHGALSTEQVHDHRLALGMKLVGLLFIGFFAFAFVASGAGITHPAWLYKLVGWGIARNPEDQMLSAIYVVWGAYLLVAARRPRGSLVFVDFTIVANAAHMATMLGQ